MYGQELIGIGLLIGPPLAAIILKYAPVRNGSWKKASSDKEPGRADTCISHAKALVKLQTHLNNHVQHTNELLQGIKSDVKSLTEKLA